MLWIAWIGGALLALIASGASYQWLGTRRDARRYPPPGLLVDIGGGQRIHLYALGAGSPTVILESGVSATSLNWRGVQKTLAPLTRVVAYDRAGLGWSDSIDTPRTASQIAAELHAALKAAQFQPPYILVAHSFGGLVARRFAHLYTDELAGIVLVDPLAPQEWWPLSDTHRRNLRMGIRLSRRGASLARIGMVRATLSLVLSGSRRLPQVIGKATGGPGSGVINRIAGEVGKMPREVWPMVAAQWSDPKSFLGMAAHFESLPESVGETLRTPPLEAVPVIDLTAGKNPRPSDEQIRAIGSNVRHVVARDSGHWIHLDQPDLVTDAVRSLVEASRIASPEVQHK